MVQCRDDSCLMGFSTERHRNAHESLMHKTLMDSLVVRMVDKILMQNSPDKTSKKIIKTDKGAFSYKEAKSLLESDDSDNKTAIKSVLRPIVEMMFESNPEWTARELLSVPEFKLG